MPRGVVGPPESPGRALCRLIVALIPKTIATIPKNSANKSLANKQPQKRFRKMKEPGRNPEKCLSYSSSLRNLICPVLKSQTIAMFWARIWLGCESALPVWSLVTWLDDCGALLCNQWHLWKFGSGIDLSTIYLPIVFLHLMVVYGFIAMLSSSVSFEPQTPQKVVLP